LIFGKGDLDFSGTLKGNIFILINAFSYALYLVLVKPLMKKYNPLTIVKWIFIFAAIPIIPFSWKEVISTDWQNFTPAIWISFFYVLIFVTFFSYLLNASALKKVKPSTVGIYIYLQPVIASLVALSLGRDELSLIKIISGIIIIYGVYLVSTQKSINFLKK
jgi:drug/metabolite transporter (DMT)-like permease